MANSYTSQIEPLQDFDWDAYESSGSKNKHNTNIKTKSSKDKVYSTAPNAQELYDLMIDSTTNLTIPHIGSLIKGEIESIGTRYAYIDIGWRECGILDLNKEQAEDVEMFQKGMEIDVVVKKNNITGSSSEIEVSYSEAIKHVKYQEIFASIGKPVAFLGKVNELIHGGYFIDVNGVNVFMPGSLGGVNKLVDFSELLNKEIYVCPINYSKEKDYIVVSHRAYLQALIPEAMASIDPGDSFSGFITGTTKFGVFVEFNKCLTGLIHKTDLDDVESDKFNKRELKPGDEIEFTIKEISSTNRIILTQKEFIPVVNPWDGILDKYKIPSKINGRIRKKTKYGLFVELEPKVVGLLHVSDIPDSMELDLMEEGDNIELNLIKIDVESKKVFFKI